MNNFKFASKLKIFAAISFVIIVLGMALGTVFHFIGNGFFNYGGEYSSCKTVNVNYVYSEFGKEEDIITLCETEFEKAGLKSYTSVSASSSTSNNITYKFSYGTDDKALEEAVAAINESIASATKDFNDVTQSRASFQTERTLQGGEKAVSRAAIVLGVIIVIQALYALLRYKLSAMLTSCAIQLHNLGLFAALLALCRVPVTSAAATFAVMAAIVTSVILGLTLEALKRARKDSDNAKLLIDEICDLTSGKAFKTNLLFSAFLAIAAILVYVFTAISALSPVVILSASACALVAFVSSFYGSVFLAPAVYPLFFKMCGKTAKPSQKKGN